jgi:hypothetical protein
MTSGKRRRAMISKTVLTALAVVLMAFPPAIARDWNSYEDGRRDGQSEGRGPSVAQEKLKEKREEQRENKRQEDSDRKQRAIKEEQETRAQDARRESAHKESKAAHRAKVKKMRKVAGSKPHNSWQLK